MAASKGKVVQLTDANFRAEVKGFRGVCLVFFQSDRWCELCRQQTLPVKGLAKDYAGKAKVCKLDARNNRRTAAQWFHINSFPTFIVFKDGRLVKRINGFSSKERLAAALDETLVSNMAKPAICQRCKKRPAKPGFLYCPDCIKALKQEMDEKGYLQRVQKTPRGPAGSRANIRPSPADDSIHRLFEELPGEIENA